mmetsp:Transcript_5131/g.9503  ORF Transcript_5131/g.9503 Transcript_5131/m.9503 type:complete len:81 (+) Transcript_5131:1190-1432(+)
MLVRHRLKVTIVSCRGKAFYNAYLPSDRHLPRLIKLVDQLYEEVNGAKIIEGIRYLELEISSEDVDDGSDMITPLVKYNF